MNLKTEPAVGALSVWTMRVVLFSGALLLCTVLLHRLLGMSTPIALNLFAAGLAGAGIAFLLGAAALVNIWRRGVSGLVSALGGMAIAAGIFAVPLSFLPSYQSVPPLNDISTDLDNPPRFAALAKVRTGTANGPDYPRQRFAKLQGTFYPDVRPFVVDRPAEEAYELALDAMRRLKVQVVSEEPPKAGRPGSIEAVDRTPIVGFYDDVAIRIGGDRQRARIDVRSASRYGTHDLGRNASRIRRITKELQARLDATVPAAGGDRISQLRTRYSKTAVPKRLKGDPKATKRGKAGVDASPQRKRF